MDRASTQPTANRQDLMIVAPRRSLPDRIRLIWRYRELLAGLVRKELKVLGSKGPLPQRPTGSGYSRCVNAARIVANKLTEHGDPPQDMLDLHDFVHFTLKKPLAAARRPKAATKAAAKAPKKKPAAVEADDDASDESSEDAD